MINLLPGLSPRQIVEFAQKHHVSVIVFEDLSNWKAKGGKQGALQKQRFHQWCKDKLVELTIQKFSELGGKVSKINAKYTNLLMPLMVVA